MKFGALGALGGLGSALSDIGAAEARAQAQARAEAAREAAIERQWLRRHELEQAGAQATRQQQTLEAQQRRAQLQATLAGLPEGATDLDRARALTEAGFADEGKQYADLFKTADMSEHRELTRAAQREAQLERIAAQRARLEATQAQAGGPTGGTSNFKQLQAVNELQTLFGTKDAFGEFSLAPENKTKYLEARDHLNKLLLQGVSPEQAVMDAYAMATGRLAQHHDDAKHRAAKAGGPGATRPPLSSFRSN